VLDSRWFWPPAALAIAPMLITNPHVRYGLGMTVANLGIAAIILRCVSRPASRVSRVLERPSLVWIGTLSYSLYLWQQMFVNRHSASWIHQFPVNIVGAFAAAIACHYLIERPCLRMNPLRRAAEAPARELSALGRADAILDVSAHQAELRRVARQTTPGTRTASRADT
jgi:peptidoglycan/LPS O-acetylase OafA/YrhL